MARLTKDEKRFQKEAEALRLQEEERKKAEQAEREAFLRTPRGQARLAKEEGRQFFQFMANVSQTTARIRSFSDIGDPTARLEKQSDTATDIETVESEGWRLEHAGYVFQQTHSLSKDKFMSSGQKEAISGNIVGIYTFRSAVRPEPSR